MRESIGVTGVFQIVILFIILFTGIMCLTLNNTNAFAVKNELINTIVALDGEIIEGNKLDDELIDVMKTASYRNTGKCDDDYLAFDKEGNETNPNNASICIKPVNVTSQIDKVHLETFGKVGINDFIVGKYYKVVVFYQLDIPIIKQFYDMKSVGETKIIYNG